MAKEIDEEIRNIIENAYVTAEKLLTENIDKLHMIASTLLEVETLDGAQFEALFTGAKTPPQLIEEVQDTMKAIEEANALEAALDPEGDEDQGEDLVAEDELLDEDGSADDPSAQRHSGR
jgi:cell division protease FtsH